MRVLPAMAALVVLVLTAGACSSDSVDAAERPLDVVVTFSILGDIVAEVGGDDVEVTTIVPLGGDPHVYEPTPSDAAAVADAALVIDNGLGLAPWFTSLSAAATGGVVSLGDALAAVAVVDEVEQEIDPHTWMVPAIVAERYVPVIADALATADPDNASSYAERAEQYAERLMDLDAEIETMLDQIPSEHRLLVTSHDAYSYFGARYGIEVATPIGVTTEEEPSAATVARLIDEVRASGIPTIFVETTVNPSVVERIAADAGVDIGDPLYGDSVGEPGSGADSYEGMIRANAQALVDGLAP